ncbi:MAG TPA: hypothetical protein VFH51_19980, partial [Myxococcota bacterium]|nr:hypothetical protein [Myxococcota bacterium]
EASQESSRWGGSVFTSALVSALSGAADATQRGTVTLHEAYAYAFAQTVLATRQTISGPQHPTFEYALRGKGSVILTAPGQINRRFGAVRIARPGHYFFLRAHRADVALEATFTSGSRQVQLPAGLYEVERRASDHLQVGRIEVESGLSIELSEATLRRVDYDQAIRKGGWEQARSWTMALGWQGMGALASAAPASAGPLLAVDLHGAHSTGGLRLEVSWGDRRGTLPGSMTRWSGTASWMWPVDLGPFSVSLGGEGGLSLLREDFAPSRRQTPPRLASLPILGLQTAASYHASGGWVISLRAGARAQILREGGVSDGSAALRAPVVPTVALLIGWQGMVRSTSTF